MTDQLFARLTRAPRDFVQPHELSGAPPETPLLVALSGGADSRLLLHLAVRYREFYGTPIYAAHLNHGIRGEEADRDEAFCREITEAADVPFFAETADVPALAAATGDSLELAARRARYDFLTRLMRAQHIPLLLTAHHADDQLETLILRLLRGTGTRGMGGIAPVRPLDDLPGGLVLRPLLGCTKADILEACAALGLTYVTDSTNALNDCTRNRIRHEIRPALEAIAGPGVPAAAADRLARAAREDDAYLTALAGSLVGQILIPTGGISPKALNRQHPAIARRVLSLIYAQRFPDTTGARSLQAVHLDGLLALCAKGIHGSAVALPGGTEGRISDGTLIFVPAASADESSFAKTAPTDEPPLPLAMGENPWDGGRFIIDLRIMPAPVTPPEDDHLIAWAAFPADVPRPLWARRRRPGDVMRRHGVGCKLKKLLCDTGVPPSMRDRLPLLCLDGGETPLWFPTAGFADGYPAPREGEALLILLREVPPDLR